jgi:hypothetical protein
VTTSRKMFHFFCYFYSHCQNSPSNRQHQLFYLHVMDPWKLSNRLTATCQPSYCVTKHRNESRIDFKSNNPSCVRRDIWKSNLFKCGTWLISICCQIFPSSKTSINGVSRYSVINVKLSSWRFGIQWRIIPSEWISKFVSICKLNFFNDGTTGRSSLFIDRGFGILKKKTSFYVSFSNKVIDFIYSHII